MSQLMRHPVKRRVLQDQAADAGAGKVQAVDPFVLQKQWVRPAIKVASISGQAVQSPLQTQAVNLLLLL